MVSYHFDETVRRSSLPKAATSRRVPGCENQGNTTPGDVERRAPNKVRLFQVNKSYKICAVTLLIVALSVTPALGASEADLLQKLLENKPYPNMKQCRDYIESGGDSEEVLVPEDGTDTGLWQSARVINTMSPAETPANEGLRSALINYIRDLVGKNLEKPSQLVAIIEDGNFANMGNSYIARVASNYLKFIHEYTSIAKPKRRGNRKSRRSRSGPRTPPLPQILTKDSLTRAYEFAIKKAEGAGSPQPSGTDPSDEASSPAATAPSERSVQ